MVPLVINDDPSRLVQICLNSSVGQGGRNLDPEVRLVQAMLNKVPFAEGGPSPNLNVDGLVGPLTISAITRFQRSAKLRVTDGRIDPLGPTIIALGRLLNSRNLLPVNMPGIGLPDERIRRGITSTQAAPPVRHHLGETRHKPFGPTDWKFKSSGGVSIGAWVLGVARINFYLEQDRRPGYVRQFPWTGVGAGLSAMPIGLDVSFADFPSWGLRLRQGPLRGSNPLPEDDLVNPCTIYTIGANAGPGWSGALCLFGAYGPIMLSAYAIGAMTGMQVGIPGAAINGFWGYLGASTV